MSRMQKPDTPDLVAAEPGQVTVLFENKRLRVLEVRAPVGAKQAMHWHPDHIVYPLGAYRLNHIAQDGTITIGEQRLADVVWIPSESHAGENIGDTEIHSLIVELLEPDSTE